MHVAAGMQVAAIDAHAAAHAAPADLEQLDAEVPGEGSGQHLGARGDRDRGVLLGHRGVQSASFVPVHRARGQAARPAGGRYPLWPGGH